MTIILNKLTPLEAAEAADTIYDIKSGANIQSIFKDSAVESYFDFVSNDSVNRFSAKTGAFEFKSKTGFGVIAKGTGKFEGDAIIICRGTSSLYDWLTDGNVGVQTSLSGNNVHAGFNRTFNGFAREIIRFINRHQPRTIHCVGHSLGGALATLAADLVIRKEKQAVLYTFGSPRVGFIDLANKLSLSSRMGVGNIHRVYHAGDPVAMVPLWPFVHSPQPKGECYIGKFLEFNPMQHLMGSYMDSVAGQSWKSLTKSQPNWDSHINNWITSKNTSMYYGLNFYNLSMAMSAIKVAIKDIMGSALMPISLMTIGGVTFLDQLSIYLEKAAKVSTKSKSFILNLMKRLLKMCGVNINAGQNLTHSFIRYVLNQLTTAINRSVSLAMQIGKATI